MEKIVTSQEFPVNGPFPPDAARSRPTDGRPLKLTRAVVFTDICLVAVWGAMIPGLMWLGAAAGF